MSAAEHLSPQLQRLVKPLVTTGYVLSNARPGDSPRLDMVSLNCLLCVGRFGGDNTRCTIELTLACNKLNCDHPPQMAPLTLGSGELIFSDESGLTPPDVILHQGCDMRAALHQMDCITNYNSQDSNSVLKIIQQLFAQLKVVYTCR